MDFAHVDQLSPEDFERYVAEVLEAAGWTDVARTRPGRDFAHGDGGVDILAMRGKRRFAVQVKHRRGHDLVGVAALNQVIAGARLYGAPYQILVTNSYFTSEVNVRSLRLGVTLVDRDALRTMAVQRSSEIGRDIKPRKYQQAIIDDINAKVAAGQQRFLIEMATGLGKTYTAAHLVKAQLPAAADAHPRVLFLAHHVELLLQAVTSFKNVLGVGNHTYSACFDGSEPEDTDFVFASFDTMHIHLHRLSSHHFDIVIVDEAHHAPARTYGRVVDHFAPRLRVGLTATPTRSDQQDVLGRFGGEDGHVGRYDLSWALRHRKLAFPRYLVLLDDLDQAAIDGLQLGLTLQDIDRRLFLHKKNDEVVSIILRTIRDKQIDTPRVIIFCRNIRHMKHLLPYFPAGTATLVHSHMTGEQRRNNIAAFRDGSHQFILACDLFNEGIDIPETNVLVFLRFTGSRTIWLQQLGRGLRKTATKDVVHVLDFVGSLDRLTEIRGLANAIARTPVDPDEVEVRPDHVAHQDTSIEINYSESAAQVLQLVEKLQYRLTTRGRIMERLRRTIELTGALPRFEELDRALGDTTYDQIATYFESYSQLIDVTLGPDYPRPQLLAALAATIATFRAEHGVTPSARGATDATATLGLPLFTEQEVRRLMNDGAVPVSDEDRPGAAAQALVVPPLDDAATRLLAEHRGQVHTIDDVRALSSEQRAAIRRVFRSEFLFLRRLHAPPGHEG